MSESPDTLGSEGRDGVALALGAGGAVTFVLGLLLHSRILRLLGFVATAVGGGLYVRTKLSERSERIDVAETSIRSTLDDLDPIARAQIIKDLIEP